MTEKGNNQQRKNERRLISVGVNFSEIQIHFEGGTVLGHPNFKIVYLENLLFVVVYLKLVNSLNNKEIEDQKMIYC